MNITARYIQMVEERMKIKLKDECKTCIDKFGTKLNFVKLDSCVYCILKTNGTYDIRQVGDCATSLRDDSIEYSILLGHFLQNTDVVDLNED